MIKLIEITNKQLLCEAFGITDEQATAIKKDVYNAFKNTNTWTECIECVLSKDDTPLLEAFKMFAIGELLGVMKE